MPPETLAYPESPEVPREPGHDIPEEEAERFRAKRLESLLPTDPGHESIPDNQKAGRWSPGHDEIPENQKARIIPFESIPADVRKVLEDSRQESERKARLAELMKREEVEGEDFPIREPHSNN